MVISVSVVVAHRHRRRHGRYHNRQLSVVPRYRAHEAWCYYTSMAYTQLNCYLSVDRCLRQLNTMAGHLLVVEKRVRALFVFWSPITTNATKVKVWCGSGDGGRAATHFLLWLRNYLLLSDRFNENPLHRSTGDSVENFCASAYNGHNNGVYNIICRLPEWL